jgi:hypothetical protein
MAGIRIHHAELRNCTLLVPHPGEIKSFLRTKNKGRKPKDYHINLDNEGNCIVSETVWKRLLEANVKNFIVLNEIQNPPTLSIGMQEGTFEVPAVYKQIGEAIRAIAPPGVKTVSAVRRV